MTLDGFNCHGMWFIPLIICFILFIIFNQRKGVGLFSFFSNENTDKKERAESGLETLNKRYAKGELTRSEYEAIKRDIEH